MAIPPGGTGIYARDQGVELLARFDMIALQLHRADTASKCRELRSRGKKVFLTSFPNYWEPATWPAEIAAMRAAVVTMGATGFIADAEGNWRGHPQRDQLAFALGQALARAAKDLDRPVGFTSYPDWAARAALARGCDGAVWASPQIYAMLGSGSYSTGGRELLARWFRSWQETFGATSVIPSITGWKDNDGQGRDTDPRIATPDGFDRYLSDIPTAGGFLAWTGTGGSSPPWMIDKLVNFRPGGLLGSTAEQVASILTNPLQTIEQAAAGNSTLPIIALVIAIAVIVLSAALAVFLFTR